MKPAKDRRAVADEVLATTAARRIVNSVQRLASYSDAGIRLAKAEDQDEHGASRPAVMRRL
jgi:hypothetical protein